MDSQYFNEEESAVCLPRYDQLTTFPAALSSADINAAVDFSSTDDIHYLLGNEGNEEVDIETITVTRLDIEMKSIPEQEPFVQVESSNQYVLTDEIHHEKQVEAILRLQDPEVERPSLEPNSKIVEPLPETDSLNAWKYVQYSDTNGETYQLAVNTEVSVDQINAPYAVSEQSQSSQLYRLLGYSNCGKNDQEPESIKLIYELYDPATQKSETSELADSSEPVEKMIVDDCSSNQDGGLQETQTVVTLTGSPTPASHEPIDNFQPITMKLQSEVESQAPANQAHSEEEIPSDAVGPSPSNPEPALDPALKEAQIGPFCTAARIFANDCNLATLPDNRAKLPADQLKNGHVFELFSHVTELKIARKHLVRFICAFFDIPHLDWEQPSMVCRFFTKLVMPMIASRAQKVKLMDRYTYTRNRNASQTNKEKNRNDPQSISQFDAAIFKIPSDMFEPPRRTVKVERKAVTSKKPTQAQQLLDIQNRFDAFRRQQRKHNGAFLRHLSLMQRQVEALTRFVPKRYFSERRRSTAAAMPNITI